MVLSYSFRTRTTSGFLKGTAKAKIGNVIEQLTECASPVSHPFLLPVLMLYNELGADNDKQQRKLRSQIREMDSIMTRQYRNASPAPDYRPRDGLSLNHISHDIALYQSEVNWKRPQAWRHVVERLREAEEYFWARLAKEDDEQVPRMKKLHDMVMSRTNFYQAKLDGLESYTQVSQSRLDNLRQVASIPRVRGWPAWDDSPADSKFFIHGRQTAW